MTTLNKYIKHMEIDSTRRLPSDIYRLAEETYFSESRDKEIKKGDMELFHLIRALIKNSNEKYLSSELDKTEKENRKLKRKVEKLTNIIKED